MSRDRSNDELWLALWDILLTSGADVSEYAHETRTRAGRSAGFEEFKRRGSTAEVVAAVEELRATGEDELREAARWLRHADRLHEIPGAADGLPTYNPLWDASFAMQRAFGVPEEE